MYASHHDEDGNIRIRFENLSRRLNKINVDILHKEPESYHLQATLAAPDSGALGCFTLDEFELLKTSDNSPSFKKLYREVINLIQSLPELLHHQAVVIQHFITFFKTAPAKDLASGFSLLSVLGRDLDKELYTHFHDLFNVLVNILPKVAMSGGATPEEQTPNPELTAKLFESLSYLLRANLSRLIESPHEISPYYGSLLSYPLHFVRDFAAKSLTIVIRKLSNKTFKDHFKKLIKATASNVLQVVGKDSLPSFVRELYQHVELAQHEQSLPADKADGNSSQKADNIKKSRNLLHGLSQMVFYTLKGITGQLHSKATQRLETLVKIVLSYADNGLISKENVSEEDETIAISNTISQVSIGGAIISSVIQELQEHLHSEYQKDLLLNVILLCSSSSNGSESSYQKTSSSRLLVNTLFLFKLRVLIQVITARKGKSVRSLETSVLNRFVEVCFDVIRSVQHLHHELASASDDTIHLNRQLLVNLWSTFPTNKIVLSQIKSLLEVQCLEIQPSQAILYFSQEWMPHLPRSITVEHLLPVLTSSIKKLQHSSVMSNGDWLAMVYNVITLIKDNRHDLVKFQDKVLPVEKLPIYEDDYVVGDDLIDCIDPVSTIFLEVMKSVKSDKSLSDEESTLLTLSAKILTWFTDQLDEQHAKLTKSHQVLVEVISNSLKTKKSSSLVLLSSQPDLLLLLASGVDYIDSSNDVNAGRLLSDLIKHLVDTILAQESFPTIGTTFALNALIEKFPDCVEEVPDFLLSSLLSPQTTTAFVEKLSFALTTPSYWLKLEILRVLSHFQPPLDSNAKKSIEDTPSEPMDVVRLCLECLCHPIDLQHEREIARRLEIVEVWCRGTKLSKDFMSIATGFCIGFLNIKFKPLWNTLIQVLVTISQTSQGEEILWNMLYQYFGPKAPITPAESVSSGRHFSAFSSSSLLEGLESLQEYNNGDIALPIELVQSSLFWWKVDEEIATLNTVLPDARADLDMVYSSIFQVLQKAPHITLKRSKLLVTAFLRFLRTQFYQAFPDEPEISSLSRYGVFLVDDEIEELNGTMSLKQVRSRLEAYLTAFGAVQSPRQLFKHQVLYIIYGELLCKPDNNLSKLALECILTYKQPEVIPYKTHLRKLYEDRTFREELIILSTPKPIEEEDENRIKEEHKIELFPIIIRILFGRLTARGGAKRADREQTSSRRVAVLAFVATLPTEFIGQLLYLMIRGITPIDDVNRDDPSVIVQFKQNIADIRVVTSELHDSYSKHVEEFMQIDSNTLSKVYWDKLIGFLFLLESVISNLGLGLQDYIGVIHHVLEQTLIYAHSFKSASIQTQQKETEEEDDDDNEDVVDDHVLENNEVIDTDMITNDKQASIMNEGKYSANVRTMCIQRLTGLVAIFHSVFDFKQKSKGIFSTILPLIAALPSAMISATRPPALLLFLDQVSRYDKTMSLLVDNDEAIRSIITCISIQRANIQVTKIILEVLDRLLNVKEGAVLRPFAEDMVVMFTRRLVGGQSEINGELKLSAVEIGDIRAVKHELSFLCKVGSLLFANAEIKIDSIAANNFATLVLGLIKVYVSGGRRIRVSEDWIISVLHIFKSLIWRIIDASHHTAFISKLFGPASPESLFNVSSVRRELTDVYLTLCNHPSVVSVLKPLGEVMVGMTKQDPNVLDSRDYASLVPIFQALGSEDNTNTTNATSTSTTLLSWTSLMGPISWNNNTQRPITTHLVLCCAPLYETLRCMYDNEMFVRKSALTAMKELINQCIQWDEMNEIISDNGDIHCGWLNLFQSTIIPALRKGIKYSSDNVRCGFIALLAHMIRVFTPITKLHHNDLYHIDLFPLIHDDPDQDFFENISHIQVHRRARAFAKLRTILQDETDNNNNNNNNNSTNTTTTTGGISLRASTIIHILLPISYHYLLADEFSKKLHQKLLEEVSTFLGSLLLHLPWNHYYTNIKKLITMLSKANEDKEKFIQTALCSSLDSFHFDMTEENIRDGGVSIEIEDAKKEVVIDTSTGVIMDDGSVEIRADRGVEEDPDDLLEHDLEVEVVDDPVESTVPPLPSATTTTTATIAEKGKQTKEIEPFVIPKESQPVIKNSIAACVVRTIIPWLKAEMVKQITDKKGRKKEKVQTSIALAIANLIKHLEPPIVTAEIRMGLFSNIVINIVNTLKSRDVKIRDVARTSLAKMINIIGLGALRPVLFELRSLLTEGYQRHVSIYTVRSLLASILENYEPPLNAPILDLEQLDDLSSLLQQQSFQPLIPAFDTSLPYIMEAVIEDLSEEVKDEREADGILRTTIREQKGSKYTEILEMTGRCILFRPTYALLQPDRSTSISSIHAIVTPLINGLHGAESSQVYNRLAEALQRLAAGLAKNSTICDKELLLYLHSTLQPFVTIMISEFRRYRRKMGKRIIAKSSIIEEEEDLSDMESGLPSYLMDDLNDDFDDENEGQQLSFIRNAALQDNNNNNDDNNRKKKKKKDDLSYQAPSQWLPSEWNILKEQKAIIEERNRQQKEQFKVLDGRNAPKLTGRNRYDKLQLAKGNHNASTGGVSRTTLVAIKFCLTLFYSSLKKGVLHAKEGYIQSMVSPFMPLLRSFLYITGASDVLILSIKCIAALITWGVDLPGKMSQDFGRKILKIMIQHGATITTENELCQSCVQVLVALFKRYNEDNRRNNNNTNNSNTTNNNSNKDVKQQLEANSNNNNNKKINFPLSEPQLRSLVEMLTVSITALTTTFQTASFQLIKEIIHARILLPEIYDLIVKLAEQIVLSHRKGVRDSASSITIQFILSYPLSQQRAESHLKQLINNCDYQYEEGRLAALTTLLGIIRSLPNPVLQEYAQMLFVSLTLKLVNEKSILCRDLVINVLSALIERCNEEYQRLFFDYSVKWLQTMTKHSTSSIIQVNAVTLVRIGAQSLAIITKTVPTILTKMNNNSFTLKHILGLVYNALVYFLSCEEAAVSRQEISKLVWNAIYHLLLLSEQLYSSNTNATDHAVTHLPCTELRPEVLTYFKISTPEIYQRYISFHFMDIISDLILYPHPWVRASASRLLLLYTQMREQKKKRLALYNDGYEMLAKTNSFYQIARKLCILLNQSTLPHGLEEATRGSLVSLVTLMILHPELDTYTATTLESSTIDDDLDNDTHLPVSFNPETGDYRDSFVDEEEEEKMADEGENLIYSIDHAGEIAIPDTNAIDEEQTIDDDVDDHQQARKRKLGGKGGKHEKLDTIMTKKKVRMEDQHVVEGNTINNTSDSSQPVAIVTTSGEEKEETVENVQRGLTWTMQRLRAIGADIRGQRRKHVLNVLLDLTKHTDKTAFLIPYINPILEIPIRVMMSGANIKQDDLVAIEADQDLRALAQELLQAVEQQLGSIHYMQVFAQVQSRLQTSKAEKKRKLRVEAITNPRVYAQRKIIKAMRKKHAKRRKAERFIAQKGTKRRRPSEPAEF